MNFINNYSQPVTLALGATSLALSLPDGEYRLTLTDSPSTRWEIVGAVVATGTATLQRGLEGTSDQSWADGSVIYCDLTAGTVASLIALLDAGPPADGVDGVDGKSVEMQRSDTHIQWRQVGDLAWTDLVALADLMPSTQSIVDEVTIQMAGRLLPAGGTAMQSLVKVADGDYQVGWADRVIPPVPPMLAVASYAGTKVFSSETWEPILGGSIDGPSVAAFALGGEVLVTGGASAPRVAAYRTAGWSQITELVAPSQNVIGMGASEAGGFVVVLLSSSPRIRVYNTADWSVAPIGTALTDFNTDEIVISPTGQYVAIRLYQAPYLRLYRTSDWTQVPLAAPIPEGIVTSGGLAFSADGSEIIGLMYNAPYFVRYAVADGAALPVPSVLPAGLGRSLAVNGQYLVATSMTSPRLKVYNLADFSVVAGTPTLAGDPRFSTFSPDGKLLVFCNASSPWLTVIDTTTWQAVAISEPPASLTTRPSFSSDGSHFVVALNSAPYLIAYSTADWSRALAGYGVSTTPNVAKFSPV